MRVEAPESRLAGFWGEVDRKHIDAVARWVEGERVLDVGCGYGTLAARLSAGGRDCVGIDADEESIATAKRLNPSGAYLLARAEDLPFPDGEFSTVVVRDALHHLVVESDWPAIASELTRVMVPGGRLVVLDPNINFIVKASRRIVGHEDAECPIERARTELIKAGYAPFSESFNTVFSLPLSGGYVGPVLVPGWQPLHRLLMAAEGLVERVARALRLERVLCWRYVLVADAPPGA